MKKSKRSEIKPLLNRTVVVTCYCGFKCKYNTNTMRKHMKEGHEGWFFIK